MTPNNNAAAQVSGSAKHLFATIAFIAVMTLGVLAGSSAQAAVASRNLKFTGAYESIIDKQAALQLQRQVAAPKNNDARQRLKQFFRSEQEKMQQPVAELASDKD